MKLSRERFDELARRVNNKSSGPMFIYDYGFYCRLDATSWTATWWHKDDILFIDMLIAEEKLMMMEETLKGLGL